MSEVGWNENQDLRSQTHIAIIAHSTRKPNRLQDSKNALTFQPAPPPHAPPLKRANGKIVCILSGLELDTADDEASDGLSLLGS